MATLRKLFVSQATRIREIARCAPCPGCCGDIAQIKRNYDTTATAFLERTKARITATSYLTNNVTAVLVAPIIESGMFARLTAQFVELAAMFVSNATTVVCNFHSEHPMCWWASSPPCCIDGDQQLAKSTWFSGIL